jgi:hypothetical protein
VKRWWVPGFGVILIGVFFLALGVMSWARAPVGVVEFVDGLVIAVLCFAAGGVMLRRHHADAKFVERWTDPK